MPVIPRSWPLAHASAGADEIVLLDITATSDGRKTLVETVRRTARDLFVPFTVGGGIRTLEDAAQVFDAGADKVSINSAAVANPDLIGEIAGRFGSQAVIVAIDARRGTGAVDIAEVYVSGGRTATGKKALQWAREAEERGAGEILLTSMDRDGTGLGFDCELTSAVASSVSIPVIASGGAGNAEHFVEVFSAGHADAALAASIFHFGTHARCRSEADASSRRHSHEVAVLIPSIDLMGGKIVQLVQGEKKALEFDDFEYWIERFSAYPLVQLIDLDAAMGRGSNRELIAMICKRLPCQTGGGIRDVARASELLALGAKRVIFGSALLKDGAINTSLAAEAAETLGAEHLTFAIDSRHGKVAIQGWKESTTIDPKDMIRSLIQYCSAFLYTHIDTEGTMAGFPIEVARELAALTKKKMIVAGGIRSRAEVDQLDAIGVDAVVGMAIYTGAMQ